MTNTTRFRLCFSEILFSSTRTIVCSEALLCCSHPTRQVPSYHSHRVFLLDMLLFPDAQLVVLVSSLAAAEFSTSLSNGRMMSTSEPPTLSLSPLVFSVRGLSLRNASCASLGYTRTAWEQLPCPVLSAASDTVNLAVCEGALSPRSSFGAAYKFGTMNATVRICISSHLLKLSASLRTGGQCYSHHVLSRHSFFIIIFIAPGFSFFPHCARPFWFFPFPICARASDECNSTLRLSRCGSTALL